jgi:F420-dependent oxidoreductase-like protein
MLLANSLEYAGSPRAAARLMADRERAGVDVIWVSEAYGFDAPTMLGYLAARTERAQLGSGVMNAFSRTPTTIAQTFAGLDNVSGGRAILGLGASGPQVIEGFHGLPYRKPLGRIRDVVAAVRTVLRREEPLVLDGETVAIPLPAGEGTGLGKPLRLINRPERPSIPIYIASVAERSVAMTAEIADGWLPALWIPEYAPPVYRSSLTAGLGKRDASLSQLQIAAGGMVAVTEGEERERYLNQARQMLALYVGGMGARTQNFYNDIFVNYGFEEAAARVQDLYLTGRKDEAAAAVPADAVERLNLIGPASFVKERIAAYAESGVTMLNAVFLQDDLHLVSKVREWMPA